MGIQPTLAAAQPLDTVTHRTSLQASSSDMLAVSGLGIVAGLLRSVFGAVSLTIVSPSANNPLTPSGCVPVHHCVWLCVCVCVLSHIACRRGRQCEVLIMLVCVLGTGGLLHTTDHVALVPSSLCRLAFVAAVRHLPTHGNPSVSPHCRIPLCQVESQCAFRV